VELRDGGVEQRRYLSKVLCSQLRGFVSLFSAVPRYHYISLAFYLVDHFFGFVLPFIPFQTCPGLCFTLGMGYLFHPACLHRLMMEICGIRLRFFNAAFMVWAAKIFLLLEILSRFIHSAFSPAKLNESVPYPPHFFSINSPFHFPLSNRQTLTIVLLI